MAKEDFKGIWVFAEQEHGVIEPTVFELLAKAKELQAHNGEELVAVLMGKDVAFLSDTLFEYGADKVLVAESDALAEYSARPYQTALARLAEKYLPSIILYGATPLGRDLAPRMMISLNTGLTADAIDLGYDEDGVFYQTTPAYGGKILAHIVILERRPQMATVHPKMFAPIEPIKGARGKLIVEDVSVKPDPDYVVVECAAVESTGKSLAEAEVVVAGGRGIKTEPELAELEELAGLLGGQLGASRPPVDLGWLPHDKQIGQSGVTVKSKLILNVAISGSVQYQLGMQNSDCIVAVNQSPDAPIFDISHYGIVADYRKFVPALIAELKARKG
ncbi:MAG: electron transfer flavoprotein subunit alpha/FixB family protein [Oscillospiraceae bacterium]